MTPGAEEFMQVVAELRPALHRYCARMTGSVFDGEDVTQEALTKAHAALSQMTQPTQLEPWLFRIAHNTALDFLRRYDRKHVAIMSEVPEPEPLEETAIDPELLEAALSVFAALPPIQRSALILKDVLGHSLEQIADALGTSVAAVKGALSRARANLAPKSAPVRVREASADERAILQRYVDLFNDRNWDGLRALLGEESRLDLVSRAQQRIADARYYDRYAETLEHESLRAEWGYVDGVAAIAMFRPASSAAPAYFVLLESANGQISLIRDFRYVPYIAHGAGYTRGA